MRADMKENTVTISEEEYKRLKNILSGKVKVIKRLKPSDIPDG